MSILRKTAIALTLAVGVGVPTAWAQSGVGGAVQDAKAKFFDALDKDTVTVDFKQGSATLEDGEVSDLKALVTSNKESAKIERVIVASWADKDYPTGQGAKLSDAERKLADQRTAAIKKALTGLGVAKVEGFTMAEQPNWIEKAFDTQDAQVKENITSEIGKTLRDKGGPGKAVVVVRRQGSAPSR